MKLEVQTLQDTLPVLATSFGIALPAWIVDQKNSILVSTLNKTHDNVLDISW